MFHHSRSAGRSCSGVVVCTRFSRSTATDALRIPRFPHAFNIASPFGNALNAASSPLSSGRGLRL